MPKKDKGKQKIGKTLRHIQKVGTSERDTIFKSEDAKFNLDPLRVSQNFTLSGTDNGTVKMSESVPVSLERYVYHLKLHNHFAALTKCLQDNKNVVRSFYQNTRMKKGDMKREVSMRKLKGRVCARKRVWLNPKVKAVKDRKGKKKVKPQSSQKQLVIMIGDRGMGVGSKIKRHLRYGGTWKQDNHARYTTQLIQVKSKTVYRNMKSVFHCLNPECPSVRNGRGSIGKTLKKGIQNQYECTNWIRVLLTVISMSSKCTLLCVRVRTITDKVCISEYRHYK
ncbi:hypothetical protein BD560DRAFT_423353 [Blakeslea trispora]|nr:hypothetical protein BD560DRAFT_423353 [Blakeslea trispora]